MSLDERIHWPAAERNRDPILEELRKLVPKQGRALEISSGTGQHVAHFATHLQGLSFQPSDATTEHFASIRAWVGQAGVDNVAEPMELDVTWADWSLAHGSLDVIFNANMIHIAPWECCLGLLGGAARHLSPGGSLITYGPYRIDGRHTAQSNADFDESLRARDQRWGVRDLEEVQRQAQLLGLSLAQRIPMPANNQLLHFVR